MAQTLTAQTTAWRDPKKYLWLFGLTVPLMPFAGAALARSTGLDVFWFFTPIFIYGLVPLLELLLGEDAANPPDDAIAELEGRRYYRVAVWAFIPLQYIALIWGAALFAGGELSIVAAIGLVWSIGMIGGAGINAAHELGHKREGVDRWLSRIALAQVAYGHFYVEHNRGHHRNVATPTDPASSRLGESIYRFWPRTVIGSLRSAWQLEKERLARRGKGPLSLENENIRAWLLTALLFGALTIAFGWPVLPFLAVQAVIGFTLLETVNYLEHYGLLRQRGPDGRFERCAPEHSWNSNYLVSNLLLYHLQRHSDHHAWPTRRYQALRDYPDAPQLPAGYATLLTLAWITPLWRRVMDKRVLAHYDGDIRRANLEPARADALIARYGR